MAGHEEKQVNSVAYFGSFQLNLATMQLRRGSQEVKLTGKAFAVLRHFVEHPGQLVTKDELFAAVWPETVVSEATLASCIQELRQALRDKATAPRYIETVHRRGYRFLPSISTQSVPSSRFQLPSMQAKETGLQRGTLNVKRGTSLVGRESELAQLHDWLAKALNGERQIVFVTGEAGIGKTTLVDAFLAEVGAARRGRPTAGQPQGVAPTSDVWVTSGQCIEHYGAGEPYLPLLEALGRLCRGPGGRQVIDLLAQDAPTWLVQMPTLVTAVELEALQRRTAGSTRERMLRELTEAVEALTGERPLVLWLEDLHWCDPSTLDWLAFVARRREHARLLVLGSYRPVETIVHEHPLRTVKHDLQVHGQCAELSASLLSEAAVGDYLKQRVAGETWGAGLLPSLARTIHRRTDGNPLFMVNVVEHLSAQGLIAEAEATDQGAGLLVAAERSLPANLRQLIEHQVTSLSPAVRRTLEAASVAGAEFSAAAVADAETEVETVEEHCAELARREQFLRASGISEWPDGTLATRYRFLHALYQEVLYERLPAARRQRLHRHIGEREEQAYGDRTREIAAELAIHFERGRDYRKAIQYLRHAGVNALRRSAHHEASSLLTKGLELLKTLPDTPERDQQELRLLQRLGLALISLKGRAAPEVERIYARAYELCQQHGTTQQLLDVLPGLQGYYLVQGELHKAREVAEQGWRVAQHGSDHALLRAAHVGFGEPLFYLGELITAREHLEQAWTLYAPQEHNLTVTPGDSGVGCLCLLAMILGSLGYPDQAQQRVDQALAMAERLAHPYSVASVLPLVCMFHFGRQEWQQARARAEEVIRLSAEQGFPDYLAHGTTLRGWALTAQEQVEEGIVQMQQGIASSRAGGTTLMGTFHLLWLAAAYARVGRVEEGLTVLAEAQALVNRTGARVVEAELYMLKGWLLLARSGEYQAEAEGCFLKAIEISRKQQAKSLELRATISLARLWQQQGKRAEAHRVLSEVYNWFTEGFDTVDLKEAKALLQELS